LLREAIGNRAGRGGHDTLIAPVNQIGGKGVTPAFLAELNEVLERHELVKIKVGAEDREARDAMIAELAQATESALVQRIGHVAVLYRPSREQRQIVLPRG